MAKARKDLDWEGMFAQAMDPEKARRYRARGTSRTPRAARCAGTSAPSRS